ncbi:MAG TPA: HAD family phosphatase [Allosphingosinicella sp.]|nr:HAD family phosphatase [Allosphingosinicella sp.]
MKFQALIFDFDGVLIESEYVGNKQIADYLTAAGHPTSVEESMNNFMGLAGRDFTAAIEEWIGRQLPDDFHAVRAEEDRRVLDEGLEAVAGAVAFIRGLPPELPRAIASSSSTEWIERHLDHLGLRPNFGPHIYSGREHVALGKPAPDLYLHAAKALGVEIGRTVIIEDSPVGVQGAVASGAQVIGLCAGRHCMPGHAERLRALGVHHLAHSFDEVADLLF